MLGKGCRYPRRGNRWDIRRAKRRRAACRFRPFGVSFGTAFTFNVLASDRTACTVSKPHIRVNAFVVGKGPNHFGNILPAFRSPSERPANRVVIGLPVSVSACEFQFRAVHSAPPSLRSMPAFKILSAVAKI